MSLSAEYDAHCAAAVDVANTAAAAAAVVVVAAAVGTTSARAIVEDEFGADSAVDSADLTGKAVVVEPQPLATASTMNVAAPAAAAAAAAMDGPCR